MTQQISLFNRGYTAMIILIAFVSTLIMAYFYAEFILTLINPLSIKTSPHGLVHVE